MLSASKRTVYPIFMSYQSRFLCLAMLFVPGILTSLTCFSQDTTPSVDSATWGRHIILNNRVSGVVDAPVRRPDGSGAGARVKAQLFRVNADGRLVPLVPATVFRTSSAAA